MNGMKTTFEPHVGSQRELSKRTDKRTEQDNNDKSYNGAKNADHENIHVTRAMSAAAYRKKRNHRTVVRQAVKCTGADHCNPMLQGRVHADFRRASQIGSAQCIKSNRQTAGRRAGERS